MFKEIDTLVEKINEDYANWCERSFGEVKFEKEVEVLWGKKYIKLVRDHSVWGFVVIAEDDKKFERGDILKAANYKAPARNKARGNVLKGDFSWVRWTGPEYL